MRASRVLAVLCAAQFMVVADDTIVNVALPSVRADLGLEASELAWVVDAYLLLFGGFLLVGGRAADLLGRRRMFLIGTGLFTLVSLLCGLAADEGQLIAARGAQGLAGALLSPAALSLLLSTFPEGEGRTRALGMWGAIMGLAGGSGVLLGGVVSELLGWRWVFLVNVPLGLAILVAARRVVPPGAAARRGSLDLPGAALVTGGLLVALYAVMETRTHGWTSAHTLVGLGAGAALLALFALHESRAAEPLLPPALLRRRAALAAFGLIGLGAAALFAMFFFVSLYMQAVQGWGPLRAGASWLPFTAALLVTSGVVLQVLPGRPLRPFLAVGALVIAGGFVLLAQLEPGDAYLTALVPAMVAMGVGIGVLMVPMTAAATAGVGPELAGLASGLVTTFQQIGGAVGLAVLVTVASDRTAGLLGEGQPAGEAAVGGYASAFWVAFGLSVAAAAVASTLGPLRAPRDVVIA
ncbi:MAG TPA: MFS transporter [Capillimicrobium sp.]|jgi:EmrB/QacA subfamily drug resistance transporter